MPTAHAMTADLPMSMPHRPGAISSKAAFYLLASITVTFLAGSSAPTPLYTLYQAEWGFSPIVVTVRVRQLCRRLCSARCSWSAGSPITSVAGRC